jgi:hypothetical protein
VAAARVRLPRASAAELEELIARARRGSPDDRAALLACALALASDEGDLAPRLLARADGCPRAAAMLRDAPPHRTVPPKGRLREVCIPERTYVPRETPITGFKRGTCTYDALIFYTRVRAEHVLHPSPVAVRKLLEAVKLREVLVIASRRPSSPAIAREIARAIGWSARLEVREALCRNPFTPTAIVLRLLPTLPSLAVAEVVGGPAHPLVHELAELLVDHGATRIAPVMNG